ncbi:hypothetical protein BH23ACT12_BH23ACT12_22540 [soil metagenome]
MGVVTKNPVVGEGLRGRAGFAWTVRVLMGLPNVVGRTTEAARAQLVAAGFVVEVQESLPVPVFDTVNAQSPQPDTGTCRGATVRIRIT